MEKKSGKIFSKIWVYLARLSSFLGILENAVPFDTGSCLKFKPDVLVEWKAPLRFSRNKVNFFPRDQSLSVYYYPLTSYIPVQKLLAGTSLLDIRELLRYSR